MSLNSVEDILKFLKARTHTTANDDIQFVSGEFKKLGTSIISDDNNPHTVILLIMHIPTGHCFSRPEYHFSSGLCICDWELDDVEINHIVTYKSNNHKRVTFIDVS